MRGAKKGTGDLLRAPGEVYQFMSTHAGEFSIELMCRAFGVARSGYYAWREQGCASLTQQIRSIFLMSGQTYGSPRIYNALKAQGRRCSRRRVVRLMRAAGLDASQPRRRAHTTQADTQQRWVCNLLDRDFAADAPNRKWLVDITGIWTDEGWLYLTGVLDLFSRRIVRWALDEHMPDELKQEALAMAILQRRPPDLRLHHAEACGDIPFRAANTPATTIRLYSPNIAC